MNRKASSTALQGPAAASRLRRALALFAVAVAAPTLGLLWFVQQAAENEVLAARQRINEAGRAVLGAAAEQLEQVWRGTALEDEGASPAALFAHWVDAEALPGLGASAAGAVVLDAAGHVLYPAAADPADEMFSGLERLGHAWQLEYEEQDYAEAARRYTETARRASGARERAEAYLGAVRSLRGDKRAGAALRLARQVLEAEGATPGAAGGVLLKLRLLYVTLLAAEQDPAAAHEATLLLEAACRYDGIELTASDRRLVLAGALQLTEHPPLRELPLRPRAERLLLAERLSERVARGVMDGAPSSPWAPTLLPLDEPPGLLAVLRSDGRRRVLLLVRDAFPQRCLAAVQPALLPEASVTLLPPSAPPATAFVSIPVEEGPFAQWRLALALSSTELGSLSASRRPLYLWTAVVILGAVIVAGVGAGRLLQREVRLNRLKNDFVANVTHELKTPIASTRVLVDNLIENEARDPKQVMEYLHLLSTENARLGQLVERFLSYSRMERGYRRFTLQACRAGALMEEAEQALAAQRAAGTYVLAPHRDAAAPEVDADREAFVMALVNLLDNAWKYSEPPRRIETHVALRNDDVAFTVRDRGIGLPRRERRRVFRRFYQVDTALSRAGDGCGLGLSIVDYVVRAHRGRIEIESVPGGGTSFTIVLPGSKRGAK